MVQQSTIMFFLCLTNFVLWVTFWRNYRLCATKCTKTLFFASNTCKWWSIFGPSLIISLKIRHPRLPRGINYLHTWTSGISENNGPALVRLLESYAPWSLRDLGAYDSSSRTRAGPLFWLMPSVHVCKYYLHLHRRPPAVERPVQHYWLGPILR